MFAYRITEIDSRVIVGTEDEPILVCASREVAHRAVADAELLETLPAKLIFSRRIAEARDVKPAAPQAPGSAQETSRASRA